jgi:hypothetical protein
MLGVGLAGISGGRAAAPKFFPDDPIQVDDDRAFDARDAQPIEGSNAYDFAEHTFFKPGDRRDLRAANVNTLDEVPDSTWFTNRIGRTSMSTQELVRGPNQFDTLNVDDWPIVQEKSSGITPGYRLTDPSGHLYQVKFDPPNHPEMASGAEVIGAAIYHAVGYNVVQGYIVEIDPADRGQPEGNDGRHVGPPTPDAPRRRRPDPFTRRAAAKWQVSCDAEPFCRRTARGVLQVLRDAS